MNPVTRALQTIAAIERETRERIHAEAASTCPTETVLSRVLSTSSQPSSEGRNGPSLTDQVETTAPEAAFARNREIRIDKRDRVVVTPARDVTRHAITIVAGVLLLALVLCLGWIGGLNSDFFTTKPASPPVRKVDADPPDASAKSKRLTVQGSSANTNATASIRAHESSKRGAQTSESLPAVERTKVSTKPAPVPETKPTTIEGWTLLEVKGGTAVLKGPNGVWRATRGDTVPGVGKIDSIVRWGSRWIVATSRGLISTR